MVCNGDMNFSCNILKTGENNEERVVLSEHECSVGDKQYTEMSEEN